jgi:hypothetical protein
MNCEQARALLTEDGSASEGLAEHLAACPACAGVRRELEEVRRLLDAAPTSAVHVDLAALYRRAGELERERYRRWRRLAWSATAAAAVLLLALTLRFEVRWTERSLVIGWGLPAMPVESAPGPPVLKEPNYEQFAADVLLMKDLIHAVAADVQYRADEQRSAVAELERRVDGLSATSHTRWTATQRDVRALYTAYFGTRDKGATP